MAPLPSYQYHLESEYKSWETLLNALKNENVLRMQKLCEVLEGKVDNEFISKAEYFQNVFIDEDEYIKDMENEIKFELQSIRVTADDKKKPDTLRKFEKFKNEIKRFERNFTILKTDFDESVKKIISV